MVWRSLRCNRTENMEGDDEGGGELGNGNGVEGVERETERGWG